MPRAMPTVDAVTGTGDHTAAPGTRAAAPVPPRPPPAKTGQAALSPDDRRARLRRLTSAARRGAVTGGSYNDPLFGRPDLIEGDYDRLGNQPPGW